MLFYDLEINSWVRKPGSTSPPEISPVLSIGGKYSISITFCRGTTVVVIAPDSIVAAIKIEGDMLGTSVARTTTYTAGDLENILVVMDLTTVDANAYFTANPTAESGKAIFQLAYVISSVPTVLSQLNLTLQATYLAPTFAPSPVPNGSGVFNEDTGLWERFYVEGGSFKSDPI